MRNRVSVTEHSFFGRVSERKLERPFGAPSGGEAMPERRWRAPRGFEAAAFLEGARAFSSCLELSRVDLVL